MSKILQHFAFIGAVSIAAMAIYTFLFPDSPYWHRLIGVFYTAVCMQIFNSGPDSRNL